MQGLVAVEESILPVPLPVRSAEKNAIGGLLVLLANLMASLQFVWFYLSRVPSCIHLEAYEQWQERRPFQYRLLLVYPLHWAHSSPTLLRMAGQLSHLSGWFPQRLHPEGIVEAAIDLLSVGVTGLVARRLYQRASPSGALKELVYPLTLAMTVLSYAMLTTHQLRFVYDLPSVAFFAVGLYLIYTRGHAVWFALVFVIATVNRETTLFLLLILALDTLMCDEGRLDWRRMLQPRPATLLAVLSAYWVSWHLWVTHRFAANPAVVMDHRIWLNLALLLVPLGWPQLCAAGGYVLPLLVLHRSRIPDARLRAWFWILPLWILMMLRYGLLIEVRIFGEMIPYLACVAVLILEKTVLPASPASVARA